MTYMLSQCMKSRCSKIKVELPEGCFWQQSSLLEAKKTPEGVFLGRYFNRLWCISAFG